MPPTKPELYLHEQVLLLALRDEAGSVESRAGMFKFGLGGALLSELLIADCIRVTEQGRKRKYVELVKKKRLYEPLLEESLDLVFQASRRKSPSGWVSRFANMKRLHHRVAEGLCRRGILKDSEDKVLLIFKRKVYPTIDSAPERRLIQQIKRALVGSSREIDSRVALLIALANATGLLRVHFDKATLKRAKPRLDMIAEGKLIGGATAEAVRAAQAAAMAAIVAATTASTMAAVTTSS